MIEVRDIVKSYGTLQVLRGVSLRVEKGEIVSIVGKSGVGKTTLLQIIGTLDKADSGQVLIDEQDISQLGERELARFRNQHIGFIFQFHQLLPEFTALENVMMPCLISGMSRQDAARKARVLLEDLGLAERLDHKPAALSGGEKQRVAVARAMVMNPTIILADEPTGSLDSANKRDLSDLLLRLRRDYHLTILIVTHDQDLAAISDRIIELKN